MNAGRIFFNNVSRVYWVEVDPETREEILARYPKHLRVGFYNELSQIKQPISVFSPLLRKLENRLPLLVIPEERDENYRLIISLVDEIKAIASLPENVRMNRELQLDTIAGKFSELITG